MSDLLSVAIRAIKADAWDEGYAAGDPYHRRGNPDTARNPYRDLLTGDDITAFAISGDHDTRNDNDGPGRARV